MMQYATQPKIAFRSLELSDKDYYNYFFELHDVPVSDYCFSVIQTWLVYGGPVEVAELTPRLLLLRYVDVLDTGLPLQNYTLIGDPSAITREHIDYLVDVMNDHTKVIITEPHRDAVHGLLPANVEMDEERGLEDYIYSVPEYDTLEKPEYRRIRQKVNIYKRLYGENSMRLREVDLTDVDNIKMLLNAHHTWEGTFQFGNDPTRTEGLILDMSFRLASSLGLRCAGVWIDDVLHGFFIYTEVNMNGVKYADTHNTRLSYAHKYVGYCAFHLFGKYLHERHYDFINFERDADIEGLRDHKLGKKPVRLLESYSLRFK